MRFGLWWLHTPLTNIAGTEVTGPFGLLRTLGPAHLSLADNGITFATNGDRGLCIRLHDPVRPSNRSGASAIPASPSPSPTSTP